MMISELKDIKILRKKLGLTQSELAIRSGVSQSLIAKVEAGSLDPTYSNANRILAALEGCSNQQEKTAEEVMQRKMIKLAPSQDLMMAIRHMKRYEISQMPVIDKGQLVGYVSDSIILDTVLDGKAKNVGEIMKDPPPVIAKNTSISVVTNLLRYYPFIMVSEKGKLKGLITKADILRNI